MRILFELFNLADFLVCDSHLHYTFFIALPVVSVSRVKAEPSVDGVREPGVQVQAVTPSPNPTGSNSADVKPSVADSIQTSGAYCSREENLKKEVGL